MRPCRWSAPSTTTLGGAPMLARIRWHAVHVRLGRYCTLEDRHARKRNRSTHRRSAQAKIRSIRPNRRKRIGRSGRTLQSLHRPTEVCPAVISTSCRAAVRSSSPLLSYRTRWPWSLVGQTCDVVHEQVSCEQARFRLLFH